MAGVATDLYECPVCTNIFDTPKLLGCFHLLCRSCVLSWLQKTERRGECPICRAPIFSAVPQDPGQLEAQVDNLPTDIVTQVLADSHKILSDPDECKLCPNNVAGQNFCLQCSVKLCTPCTIYHQKIPATSHHTLEKLNKLTVKTLAARHHVKCKTHTQQVVELYCPSHGKLICCRCGATTHRVCPEIKEIKDVAKEERRKFKDQLGRMMVKERKMAKQVNDVKEQFKAMRKTAKDVFDDLSESVEKQRRDVNNLIQTEEDLVMALLAEVEKAQLSMALPLRNIENLVLESPDDGLLEMLQQLASRLDNLEAQLNVKYDVRDVKCLVFDDQIITCLKSDLAKLGQIQQPQIQPTPTPAAGATPTNSTTASGLVCFQSQPTSTPAAGATPRTSATASGPTTAAKSQGAALARVLKVGDRVKLAPELDGIFLRVKPGDTGTVTAIPSQRRTTEYLDPEGWVDVRWDRSGAFWHRMGRHDNYDLILA